MTCIITSSKVALGFIALTAPSACLCADTWDAVRIVGMPTRVYRAEIHLDGQLGRRAGLGYMSPHTAHLGMDTNSADDTIVVTGPKCEIVSHKRRVLRMNSYRISGTGNSIDASAQIVGIRGPHGVEKGGRFYCDFSTTIRHKGEDLPKVRASGVVLEGPADGTMIVKNEVWLAGSPKTQVGVQGGNTDVQGQTGPFVPLEGYTIISETYDTDLNLEYAKTIGIGRDVPNKEMLRVRGAGVILAKWDSNRYGETEVELRKHGDTWNRGGKTTLKDGDRVTLALKASALSTWGERTENIVITWEVT